MNRSSTSTLLLLTLLSLCACDTEPAEGNRSQSVSHHGRTPRAAVIPDSGQVPADGDGDEADALVAEPEESPVWTAAINILQFAYNNLDPGDSK